MNGYGIKCDGKPFGIWPTSLSHCRERVRAMKTEAKYKHADILIVPVYEGLPMPLEEPAPLFPIEESPPEPQLA